MERSRAVIVTGGAGGIGSGIAEAFARDGDRVAIADLDAAAAEATADRLRERGWNAVGVGVDVTDERSAAEMAERVVEAFGSIDVLVNNAGLFGNPEWTGPVLNIDLEQWERVFAVNLRGVLVCSRAVAPAMARAQSGRIVNISSMGAYMLGGAYSISKLAVHHLTWSLAAELGTHNVTVNCVGPGSMDTDSNRRNNPDSEKVQERIQNAFIVKRLGRPSDIYAAIRYFASPEAEWCTGQVLLVNGGANVSL